MKQEFPQKANREHRRAMLKMHKKNHKHNIWGEWEHRINIDTELGEDRPKGLINAWLNNIYGVQEYQGYPWPKIIIGRHDKKTNVTWSELQRIKNEIFGAERMAIQIFPKASELVDVANMYWMFLIPVNEEYRIEGNL